MFGEKLKLILIFPVNVFCIRVESKAVRIMNYMIVVFNTICVSFQVKRRKKQFNPSETSCEEEDDKMEEGQGSEVTDS